MCTVTSSLTIIFDPPYYKGIFEVSKAKSYAVAEINLGTSEPKLPLIQNFILENWSKIHFFTKELENKIEKNKINPKRLQCVAKKQINQGVGTGAQVALKEQLNERKMKRKSSNTAHNEVLKQRKFAIKQEKKKAKHRGH